MKKKQVKPSTMLNLKGVLFLLAFGVWVYLLMNDSSVFLTLYDAVLFHGTNTLMIIVVLYIAILLLQFFISIDDVQK